MFQNKNPAVVATTVPGQDESLHAHHTKPPRETKLRRVLRAFLSGRTWNRFEATRDLRDWCLHSTVAEIEGRGVRILRKPEVVPGAFGAVHCRRYWLDRDAENLARAQALLDGHGHVHHHRRAGDRPTGER